MTMSVSRFSLLRFSSMALGILGLPAFAAAQHGGMAGGAAVGHVGAVGHSGAMLVHSAPVARAAAAPAAHVSATTAPHAVPRVHSGTGNATAARLGSTGRMHTGVRNARHFNNFNNGDGFVPGLGETEFDDVPGLGFDFPHLAAVSGGRNHFGRGFFGGAPFFDSGFLFGAPSVIIEQPAPGEVQSEADDAAGDAVESAPVRRARRMYEVELSPAPAPAANSAPEREVEQYVFVKRDGGLEFAVAYSWVDGTLRYITPDGRRRTLGRDALDLSATEQFNEERGIQFHAPA
jgi:hypothetical protein